MDQKIINLFDTYTHGGMSRRDFLERLTLVAGSATAATTLLPLLENNYANAAIVPENDPRLDISTIEIAPGMKGLLAFPKEASGKLPTVMVIHENRGLNPHIQDIVRRLALEGFLAFGPDYLIAAGGTPANDDTARDMIGKLTPAEVLATSQAVFSALTKQDRSNGRVAAIGFCWGGGQVNALAVAEPDLAAGVAYYGKQPPTEDVAKIIPPLLLHYAGLDDRVNAGKDAFENALKADGKTYELYVYEGVNHAFNNDTNAERYNKAAADLAWNRSIGFLRRYTNAVPD
jgi:carboxymethylenebutenolidase